jgi:hypothetical protein
MSHESDYNEHHDERLSQLHNLGERLSEEEETLPPLPQREAPGFLQFLPPFVRELWEKGVALNMDFASGALIIDGFYKHGPMRMVIRDGGKFVAIDQRKRETPIQSYDDLAKLNFAWWRRANTRGQVWTPVRPFHDTFLANKWAKRMVMIVPNEEVADEIAGSDNED